MLGPIAPHQTAGWVLVFDAGGQRRLNHPPCFKLWVRRGAGQTAGPDNFESTGKGKWRKQGSRGGQWVQERFGFLLVLYLPRLASSPRGLHGIKWPFLQG